MLNKHQHESNMRDDLVLEKENSQTPTVLLKKIGTTTYKVKVHFSETSKDTMADIVRRILEREVDNIA